MQIVRRLGFAALMLSVLVVAVSACGSSSSSSSSSPTTTGGGEGTEPAESNLSSKEIGAILTATQNSTNSAPPSTSPKPEPGKKITALVYGLEAESGKTYAEGMEKAAKAIGWEVTIVDGEFSTNKYLDTVRKAIAEGVDGIDVYVIDCPSIQAAAMEAKKAGIPLIYSEGFDCDELSETGADTGYPLGEFNIFSSKEHGDYERYITASGEIQGAAAVEASEGKMNAIALNETDARGTQDITKGFTRIANSCAECSIEKEINWVGGDLGPPLQEKVEQALLQDPEANTIYGNYDDPVIDSAAPAARTAGRSGDVYITGTAGYLPYTELIHNEEASMTVGLPVEWFAWATLDRFNRIFQGEDKLPQTGMGFELIDAEHNLPAKGQEWHPNVDFEADYEKAWNGG